MKLLGAIFFGLLTMLGAAYWMARTASQRSEDFSVAKNLASRIFTGIKTYFRDLLNPSPGTEAAPQE